MRDVVVIGASAGGVSALTALVRDFPDTLPAAVFIVLHVPQNHQSMLPAILNRAGRMPAAHAVDGEPIRRGRIYVAPPGFQTYLRKGRIEVRRGPRENMLRPAADPLFRTAAHHYGPRVIGVVLSGALDDGTAGLQAVKRAGGVAVVQQPADAAAAGMPDSAIANVPVDYVAPAGDMGPLVVKLVSESDVSAPPLVEVPLETAEESSYEQAGIRVEDLGPASSLTCPECSGAIWEVRQEAGELHFRCRVGHAFSVDTMLIAQRDTVERALWTAVRTLEERAALADKLADHARARGHEALAAMYEARGDEVREEARTIHDLIARARSLEDVETPTDG